MLWVVQSTLTAGLLAACLAACWVTPGVARGRASLDQSHFTFLNGRCYPTTPSSLLQPVRQSSKVVASRLRLSPLTLCVGFGLHASTAWAQARSKPCEISPRERTGPWLEREGNMQREAAPRCELLLSHSCWTPVNPDHRVVIRDASRITHHSDEAYVGALAVLLAIHSVLSGSWSPQRTFLALTLDNLPDSEVRDRIEQLVQAQLPAAEVVPPLWRFRPCGRHSAACAVLRAVHRLQ